jgi:coniferyl-aldehyde dehydrogenase
MTDPEMQERFDAQRAFFLADPNPGLDTRLTRINMVKEMLEGRIDDIRAALQADFGVLHPAMVDMLDVVPVTSRVDHFAANLEAWLEPQIVDLGPEHGAARGEIRRLPKGVNGNIAPWNFPIESALVMAVDMLAAGNTVMIKPSELAPATSSTLASAVTEYFEPEIMTVIEGGVGVSRAFASLPWDHLTYTGSGRVGALVAEVAARNLVPVTLELGGKNPAVFAPDAIEPELVARFLDFKALKAGQICTSPDYVMVPDGRLDDWLELARDYWGGIYEHYLTHPDATGIINPAHYSRLTGYIEEAREAGCVVESVPDEPPDPDRRVVPMTFVLEPDRSLGCMTDEVFGPIVPVLTYSHIGDALAMINDGPVPLGSYIATRDAELANRFVDRVRSGGAGVNTFGLQGGHVKLPFGGLGASGWGCHSGHAGFLNYCHTKSVFHGADDSFVHAVIKPPYPVV